MALNKLTITHTEAGFFSCSTVALLDIINYFNTHKRLPDVVDRSAQYMHYKSYPEQDLIPYYFDENDIEIQFYKEIPIPYDCMSIQFEDYRKLPFSYLRPFVEKYFNESFEVFAITCELRSKYKINTDYANDTCAVFFRGNDKQRETTIAPYEAFINKAKEIKAANPDIRFLVQPDETEFLEAFLEEFPDSIYFEETPHMRKKDSCIFYELPQAERAEYGAKFFAAVLALSQCKHLITHSGNSSLWSVLYRNNAENVYQFYNDRFY